MVGVCGGGIAFDTLDGAGDGDAIGFCVTDGEGGGAGVAVVGGKGVSEVAWEGFDGDDGTTACVAVERSDARKPER